MRDKVRPLIEAAAKDYADEERRLAEAHRKPARSRRRGPDAVRRRAHRRLREDGALRAPRTAFSEARVRRPNAHAAPPALRMRPEPRGSPDHDRRRPIAAAAAEPSSSVNNIEVIYDHVILVLKGVSLTVPQGGIVALLGANGAGKTTTLKAISNLLRAERGEVTKGSIEFEGERVDRLSPNELVRRGCIQVLEGRHCFGHLTIEENLLTGAFTRRDGNAAIRRDVEMIYDYFPRLKQRRGSMAGYTSGGEQQMCAHRPRDDVAAEDDPARRALDGARAADRRGDLRDRAQAQREARACPSCSPSRTPTWRCKYATYGYILETGRVVMDGPAKMLRENEDVKEFYLGVAEAAASRSAR